MKKIKFFGSIPAIVTPFKKNGDLDLPALVKLVDFQLRGGVDGIVVAGSTGEAATLNDEEYATVVKTVVERIKGKVPVIAGAGSNDTRKAIYFSMLAKSAGADGLLHVTPYYNKPTPDGLVAHFKAIAEEVKEVIAVKEASGSLNQMMEIINSVKKNGPKDFIVLSGYDAIALPLI